MLRQLNQSKSGSTIPAERENTRKCEVGITVFLSAVHVSYIYIMCNRNRTVLYVGVTANLEVRVRQHRNGEGGRFTSMYNCHHLVYFEQYDSIIDAIAREKTAEEVETKMER